MRKTMLTVAAACMVAVTGLSAKEISKEGHQPIGTEIANVDISSFCMAIVEGDYVTVKRMIELGEDVNRKSLGMTPAMFAARYNKVDILELLIEKGADLNIRSNNGFSVKKYAELSNAVDALVILDTALGS
ncbi:ankyrin repeat domain-containing protein [Pricia sp. S334]|uniref:Ankyrin repeat domain-containing protein n=1 Tax=Pricia mediterranea TaxID=3076079 RepID=A0ABU3L7I6_9FLAO|nr:ankyrin repeat domain-containing protein [Pricia sp. S334]MDT7829706.1 ankyrin repeat domain-containing protein [Pricia sp. S334]